MNERIKSSKEIQDIKKNNMFFSRNIGKLIIIAFLTSLAINFMTYLVFREMLDYVLLSFIKNTLIYALIIIMLILPIIYFISRNNKSFLDIERDSTIILITFSLTLGLCVISAYVVNPYVMPVVLLAMLIAATVDKYVAALSNIVISLSIFAFYLLIFKNNVIIDSVASLLSSVVVGTLYCIFLDRSHTRLKYMLNGIYLALIATLIAVCSSILGGHDSIAAIITAGVSSFFSVLIAIGFFMIFLPIYEGAFKITSKFQLAELCSLDNPLLLRLMKEAPGTYAHSLLVGNIAECCAVAIGESPMLARAGGYYHDIGKLKMPKCFIENQLDGINPHDEFIPEISLKLILDHVKIGKELAYEYRLPKIIKDIIEQHHGTTAINYFYYKVQNITEKHLREEGFRYDGPRPKTKVAAIIMIVDTVEAASRSKEVTSYEDIRGFIHSLIEAKIGKGQFGNCDITLKDLELIEDALVESLPSLHHTRVEYKKN